MRDAYDNNLSAKVSQDIERYTLEYQGFQARFTEYERTRSVGFFTQFKVLFHRNSTYLFRNKKSLMATIFNSVFISFCFSTVFWKVSDYDLDRYTPN